MAKAKMSKVQPLVLITVDTNLEALSFVPGIFNEAKYWPLAKAKAEVRKHVKANPGKPTRMPYSLAKELFGLTRRELGVS
jgi:hypothetical protein